MPPAGSSVACTASLKPMNCSTDSEFTTAMALLELSSGNPSVLTESSRYTS